MVAWRRYLLRRINGALYLFAKSAFLQKARSSWSLHLGKGHDGQQAFSFPPYGGASGEWRVTSSDLSYPCAIKRLISEPTNLNQIHIWRLTIVLSRACRLVKRCFSRKTPTCEDMHIDLKEARYVKAKVSGS